MLQYIPALEDAGWTVQVHPLLCNRYLATIYDTRKTVWLRLRRLVLIVQGYVHRFRILLQRCKHDVVWVEKELFPFLPSIFENLIFAASKTYILDYDDAVFHNYDLNKNVLVRGLLRNKLQSLIAGASAVTVGNGYLSEYAFHQGARHIERVPTVIDLTRYQVAAEPATDVFRIGWIGSPSSAQYLPMVYSALQRLAKKRNIVFVTVGAPPISVQGVQVEQYDWKLESEANLIQSFHVGIMPLNNTPWECGKCGYKLIQYMACGRPVIASPVGVNTEIVTEDVGRLANTEEEWERTLDELASDPQLRLRLGTAARFAVEKTYTKQVVAPKIDRLLRQYAGENS